MEKQEVLTAIGKLKESKDRNFNQSVDLIINLKNIGDESVNTYLNLPNKLRDPKICAFLKKDSKVVDTVKGSDFKKYDKKEGKKLAKNYDFFIASAKLMPKVGKTFGRYLGPSGKMPSPNYGLVKKETDEEIKKTMNNFDTLVRIKSKEPSLKFPIGKEDMDNEDLADNIISGYKSILNELPNSKQNVKNVMIKLTMSKPIKLNR